MRLMLSGALLALALQAAPAQGQSAADSAAIRETAMDYMQGWYTGNVERMSRSLHPDLAKRIVNTDSSGASRLGHMGADRLIEGTRRGFGTDAPADKRQSDVAILDIFGNTASVRATMQEWIDYMHMGKVNGRWVIINVLWEMKPK
jgi:Putative lumazine-binding